jgi:hypothetical protein
MKFELLIEKINESLTRKYHPFVEDYIKNGCKGPLDLCRSTVDELPDNLTVDGNLRLAFCYHIKSLPKNLHVKGSLDLYGCDLIKEFPTDLKLDGGLDLIGSGIEYLPSNLTINGTLIIQANVLARSNNLTVGDTIKVRDSENIRSLPRRLTVGTLYMPDSEIELKDLPMDLKVKDLFISRNITPKQFKEYMKHASIRERIPELDGVF